MADFTAEVRRFMEERGMSLRGLGRAAGYDASLLSKVLNGKKPASPYMARCLDDALGAGGKIIEALASAPRMDSRSTGQRQHGQAPADLLALAWFTGRLDQPVDRRTATGLAATLAESPAAGMTDPADRIARALRHPGALTEAAVSYLETRSIGFHWLEPVLPAPQLLRPLLTHLNELITVLEGCGDERMRGRLAVTVGETALLSAWIAWDCGDITRAASLYRAARAAAAESDDQAIIACGIIYQSLGAVNPAAHARARGSLAEARELLGRADHATRAWLLAREAEEAAILGDRSAKHTIMEAVEIFESAQPAMERSWTRCLQTSKMIHSQLTVATHLGDETWVYDASRELALLATDPDHKRTPRMLASIGLALACIGDISEALAFGQRSLEAIQVSRARYSLGRLAELRDALKHHDTPGSRELRDGIRSTQRALASPHPSMSSSSPGHPGWELR